MTSSRSCSGLQGFVLFAMRALIGWHFLYEGLAKLFDADWTAAGYLSSSEWVLADLFHWMAENAAVLEWVVMGRTPPRRWVRGVG